jgi:8-oxo-dGTP diphosphatase
MRSSPRARRSKPDRVASDHRAARNHSPQPITVTSPYFTYVLALLFTPDRRRVVLMHKTRPVWQAGRVNALGGKIAPGETISEAARREVREEAGVDVEQWEEFLVWDDPVYRMHVMRAFDPAAERAHMAEDQEVFLAAVDDLPPNLIDNLRWLIPLALDRDVAIPVRVRSAAPEGSGLTEPPPAEWRAQAGE